MLRDKEGLTGADRRGQVVGAGMRVAGLAGGTAAAAELANSRWQMVNRNVRARIARRSSVQAELLLNAGPREARFVAVSFLDALDGAGVLGQGPQLIPSRGH